MMVYALIFILLFLSPLKAQARELPSDIDKAKNAKKFSELRNQEMENELKILDEKRSRVIETVASELSRKEEGRRAFQKALARKENLDWPQGKKDDGSAIKFLSIKNTSNALNFNFESETERRKVASSSVPTDRERLLFKEELENNFKGSLYHPNLLNFDINLQNGLNQAREKFEPTSEGKLKNSYLDYFRILFSFLREKPYAFSLTANKSREIQNREFFDRQTIDSTEYGGNFGFKNKFIPVRASFNNSAKTIGRVVLPSQDFRDNELSLNSSNESESFGSTSFGFDQDKFSRTETDTNGQNGVSRNFDLSNQKSSMDKKKSLYSSLHFFDLTGTGKSSALNFDEKLDIEHTDYLDSSYDYSFSDRTSSGIRIKDNKISTSLRHKLYESLTSSFSPYWFKSDATTFSQDSYGLSLDEDYVKKLGKIGKLNLGAGFGYASEKRRTFGDFVSIIDEAVTLSDATVTFLNNPRVDTPSVAVTDSTGTITYVLNVDYQLIAFGERAQIKRMAIADGTPVLVDYQAGSTPSLKFTTLSDNFRARIDFLDELIGVYYRFTGQNHPHVTGEDAVILESLQDTVVGVDINYKNLKIELEDENYDSNLSPYKRIQLRESYFFNPSQKSSLTFTSSQSIVNLESSAETQKFFDFIIRYSMALTSFSRFNIDSGYRWQDGAGVGLDDIASGCGYELNLGKFLMNIRYDFKRQLYLGDKWVNHFFSMRVKRSF